ncbi:MAG: NAD(P)H-dependent glycerol-3-phosphate dehydrogenase, partial [Candidatus Cloacimonadota bacterium]
MDHLDLKIAVLGGGAWGLALAKVLSENGNRLMVWEHNPDYVRRLCDSHANEDLLKGIKLPEEISFTNLFSDIAAFTPQLIITAIPSQYIRASLSALDKSTAAKLWSNPELEAVVNVAKGVELGSKLLVHEVLRLFIPKDLDLYCLSGPSHAEEVARGLPTTVVIAGSDNDKLSALQRVFSNQYFRAYSSNDIVGVEIGGAVKNVIAIAAGILAGLGFGDNTMGALLSRGIVEIQRLGLALGAKAETFLGLSGIGDLITTATSPHSRNRYVGFEIGKGKKASEILAGMKMVAEGVATTKAVLELAQEKDVEMPIVKQVYQVLYEDKDPLQAV